MAHSDDAHVHDQKTRGYSAGHGMKEPAYGGAAMLGYSTVLESYVASTEHVVKLADYPYSNIPAAHGQVWPQISSTHVQPKRGDDFDRDYPYSPKLSLVNGSHHNSPRANSPPQGHYPSNLHSHRDSPRKNIRGNRGGFSSPNDSSSDNDEDGACYPKPKHRQDYNREKKKGNAIQHSAGHQPRNGPNHRASDTGKYYNNEKLPEANNNYNNHSKPVTDAYFDRFAYPANNEHNRNTHTKPVTDAYFDRFAYPANDEHNRNTGPMKTREDHHGDVRHWTPPGKEHGDGREVHRQHGATRPQSDKYNGAIGCEKLAKMYGGVFV